MGVGAASAQEAAAQPLSSSSSSPSACRSDPFNRWESGQRLLKKLLLKLYSAAVDGPAGGVEERCREAGGVGDALAKAFGNILKDEVRKG